MTLTIRVPDGTLALVSDVNAASNSTATAVLAALPASVRTALATELARIDVAVSTRATDVNVPHYGGSLG